MTGILHFACAIAVLMAEVLHGPAGAAPASPAAARPQFAVSAAHQGPGSGAAAAVKAEGPPDGGRRAPAAKAEPRGSGYGAGPSGRWGGGGAAAPRPSGARTAADLGAQRRCGVLCGMHWWQTSTSACVTGMYR